MKSKTVKADGKKFIFSDESEIKTHFLKTFPFESREQMITTETSEFSAVCPFSGLPDIATVIIKYRPKTGKCIELKSLKYYLTSFRPVGIYQEGVTKRIYCDLVKILRLEKYPFAIEVKTIYNTRGGFNTTCIEGKVNF